MKATLRLEAAARKGATYLKGSYWTPPFKIADITGKRNQSKLHLVLMSSSPGVLDEDDYLIDITLHEHAHLVIDTQSYQRLFTMKKSARQQIFLKMGEGASFSFLPHPVVPHKGSNFSSHSRMHLSKDCTFVWGEVITCGRKLNGEIFQFTKYHSLSEVFVSGKLVIRENLLLQPACSDVTGLIQMEGYTHQASLIYLDEKAPVRHIISEVRNYLNGHQDITAGVSMAPVNGILIRILGHKAEQLHECLQTVATHYLGTSPGKMKHSFTDDENAVILK